MLPSTHNVVDHAENSNGDKHNGCPVEQLGAGGRAFRPEAPEEGVYGVDYTREVNRNTPLAKRPSADGKGLGGGETAVKDGANGENIGDHKRDHVKGDYCVTINESVKDKG